MNNTQKISLSPLLAKKKLLDGGNSNNGSNTLAAQSFNSGIKDTPSFFTPDDNKRNDNDFGLPLQKVIDTLARKAKSVYERYLISEEGRELIAKATEYKIPFNIREVNFLELRDKVEEFDTAIERAAEYGIDWKSYGYDPIAIEQEIQSLEEAENGYLHTAHSDYWADRRVGV